MKDIDFLVEGALSGFIDGRTHSLPIRVYYEDTDFSGVVYYANYLKYFERGRSDFMRLLNIPHSDLAAREDPLAFAVAEINVKYHAPAKIDDVLWVRSEIDGSQGARFNLTQRIECKGKVLCVGKLQLVCIDMASRPRRLPKSLLEIVREKFLPENKPQTLTPEKAVTVEAAHPGNNLLV
ncbi:YbgC/FadM family acyl-CoA thioesterase [Asticcacaulis endophyticus]|uniref:Tol-pal system-associated acyl-CoA thioesterase n=1 Tax=Asticcacaulis endophyticus TaxID=1395890 RepID=A0A918Q201_9CAUL|nr:YbgC/FadM family acyl-CoA thioesterase [Asticcacaulis endophyticus]GGZ29596.1 tol-pal system-associated acyl-CoA thioesterase [Asticcacaulis endophyticus]